MYIYLYMGCVYVRCFLGCNPIFEPAELLQNSFPNRDTNLVTGMGAQSSFGNWEDLVNITALKFEVSVSPKMGPPAGPENGALTIVGTQKICPESGSKNRAKHPAFCLPMRSR